MLKIFSVPFSIGTVYIGFKTAKRLHIVKSKNMPLLYSSVTWLTLKRPNLIKTLKKIYVLLCILYTLFINLLINL